MPFDRLTVTETVGLPRESRISNALTFWMLFIIDSVVTEFSPAFVLSPEDFSGLLHDQDTAMRMVAYPVRPCPQQPAPQAPSGRCARIR